MKQDILKLFLQNHIITKCIIQISFNFIIVLKVSLSA